MKSVSDKLYIDSFFVLEIPKHDFNVSCQVYCKMTCKAKQNYMCYQCIINIITFLLFAYRLNSKNIQFLFIIHGFCICKLTYSLTFIGNPKNEGLWHFRVICGHTKRNINFDSLDIYVPGWWQIRQNSAFLFELSYCKWVSSHCRFCATFPPLPSFCVFLIRSISQA